MVSAFLLFGLHNGLHNSTAMTEEKNWLGEWSFEVDGLGEFDLFGSLFYKPGDKFALEASMKHITFNAIFDLQRIDRIKYIIGSDYKSHTNITLVDNILGHRHWSSSGGNSFKITPTIMIEGLYYENEKSLLFDSYTVKYSGLNQWLRMLSSSEISIDEESDTLTLTYKRSENIDFQIDDTLNLSIRFDYSTQYESSNETGFFLTESVRTLFESRQGEIDIEIFSRHSEHLRRLLQILYYQPCFVLNGTIQKTETKEDFPLYYSQGNKKNFTEYKMHVGYLCHYSDINNFPDVLKKWFELRKSDDYTYVTWVASKHLFINTPFPEEVFLENVRAVEVYHKARFPKSSKRQEKDTHLKDRLKYLLETLKNLVNIDDYDKFLLNENDFIEIIADNRNYLTHYGENTTTSTNLLTVPQLYNYAVKTRVILLSLLLNDIGIDARKTFGNLTARHK